jgi:DNA transposition AAA+ family ATPase
MSNGQDNQETMDRLIDDSRIMGATRVIRDPDPLKVTREQGKLVIAAIAAHVKESGISVTQIARSIGMSTSAVSEALRWQYKGHWQQLLLDLDRWLEAEVRQPVARPSNFVMTRVAQEMFTVAEAAIHLKGIGLIFGPSGIGKTLALRAIEAEKPGAVLVRMETVSTTPAAVIDTIGRTMRVFTSGNPSQRRTHLALHRIKEALRGTSRLLIVDEIHKLTGGSYDRSLNTLRDLHDATGCPMLWSGTTDLVAYLEREVGPTREPLSQIRRRIVICRDLTERTIRPDGGPGEPLFSVEEIRAMFAAGKMRMTPGAVRMLAELANVFDAGHLGACATLIAMARKVNERTADVLTEEMLQAALGFAVNRRGANHLKDRLAVSRQGHTQAARAG